ncbi:hypothetical protein V2G26_008895 [Clonostachys chloroleuca]
MILPQTSKTRSAWIDLRNRDKAKWKYTPPAAATCAAHGSMMHEFHTVHDLHLRGVGRRHLQGHGCISITSLVHPSGDGAHEPCTSFRLGHHHSSALAFSASNTSADERNRAEMSSFSWADYQPRFQTWRSWQITWLGRFDQPPGVNPSATGLGLLLVTHCVELYPFPT